MIKVLDFLGLLVYCLAVYLLSDQAKLTPPMLFNYSDKLYHAGAYFVLGILLWRTLRYTTRSPIILALFCFGAGSLFGATDEWHQSFVPGRSSDIIDWLADSIGVSLAAVCLYQYQRFWLK